MPVIVPCGYAENSLAQVQHLIKSVTADTPYAKSNDLTIVPKEIPSTKIVTGDCDPFLFVFASVGWLEKYEDDLVKRLSAHFEVLLVPGRYYPKK